MRTHGISLLLMAALTACAADGAGAPAATAQAASAHDASDAGIERALPSGQRAQHIYTGDLDGDGDADALVVTAASAGADSRPRALVALLKGDGGWRIAARNDRGVPCETCGGAMGDPLVGIDVVPGGFVLRLEGGSRELWSTVYRFRYRPAGARWLLDAVDRKVLDRATGAARNAHAGAADIGELDFTAFDPADDTLAPID